MPQKGRGRGVRRKDGEPRESTTLARKPVVDDSNWRKRLQRAHRVKFDDVAKERYLEVLRTTGRKWMAEDAAGIVHSTADRHYQDDPEFQQAVDSALAEYSTRGIVKIEREAIEGHEEFTYDKDGNLIKERRVFETRLREMFLKKHDPGYQEKQQLEVSAKPGCVVVPATLAPGDWERAVAEHDREQAKNQDPDASAAEAASE